MAYSIYGIFALFFIYSFLGWCIEVIYATFKTGKFINRGFLNGPLCPIYGVGAILVTYCLSSIKDNLIILFIGACLLTTFIEFITGFILEKIFNDKWWDYSYRKFNIKGYICLRFSLIWGVSCVFIVKVIEPILEKMIIAVPERVGVVILSICFSVVVVDFVVTALSISKFKKTLILMDEAACKLKIISDGIGENLSDGVLIAMEKKTEVTENIDAMKEKMASKVYMEKYKKELEELKEKYVGFFEDKTVGYERLFNAFPDLQKGKYKEHIDKIKKFYKKEN